MLNNIKRGVTSRGQKVVLYGQEKIGKTTLATQFPAPLFADVEGGTDQLDVFRVEIKSYDELKQLISQFAKGGHEYKTLVIDSIDWTERRMSEDVCAKNGWDSLSKPGYGKGHDALRSEFDLFLFRLEEVWRAGYHVVFIGHSEVKKFNAPDASEGYDRYELNLDKENGPKIKQWADDLLFCAYEVKVTESDKGKVRALGGTKRLIHATHTAAYDAGNRHGIADKVPMEIASLAPIFAQDAPVITDYARALVEALGERLNRDAVSRFLISRGQNENLYCVTQEFAKRAYNNIEGFIKAVNEHGNAPTQ